MRAQFERVGEGAVLNNSPYDLAAAVLCLEEAGAWSPDAYGAPLASRPLSVRGPNFRSHASRLERELHAKIAAAIEAGIERLATPSG